MINAGPESHGGLTDSDESAIGYFMTDDARQAFQKIIDYCDDRWLEADQAPATSHEAPGTKTGRKMAYNDVLQFARRMLADEKG